MWAPESHGERPCPALPPAQCLAIDKALEEQGSQTAPACVPLNHAEEVRSAAATPQDGLRGQTIHSPKNRIQSAGRVEIPRISMRKIHQRLHIMKYLRVEWKLFKPQRLYDAKGNIALSNPNILFVDDNFISNIDTCEVLREADFSVISAYCASEAIAAIGRGDPLSGLLTDIDLGPGADGFEVARRARAAYPDLPIVYISGTAAARHPTEGVADSTFLSKPCSPCQLVAALNRAIGLEAA